MVRLRAKYFNAYYGMSYEMMAVAGDVTSCRRARELFDLHMTSLLGNMG